MKLGDWVVDGELGAGGQAVVYRVHRDGDATNTAFVIKVLKRWDPKGKPSTEQEQRGRFIREVAALQSLGATGCPNIVQVVDKRLETSPAESPWYVMPFYAAGAMRRVDADGNVAYLEAYKGNIDRVLEIAETIARTLAWMHDREPRHVHRDVHTENIFFVDAGSVPVLGDFGLVHAPVEHAGVTTGAREPLGPWRWRPPELHPGSDDKANPKSDVYLLGGVIYEALSEGEYIEETERGDGSFTHELPDFNLSRFTRDARITHVNRLLRNMLARDPRARITASQVAAACKAIRQARLDGDVELVAVPPSVLLEQAAAAYREQGYAYKADVTARHLQTRCSTLAQGIGLSESSQPYRFHRGVATVSADAGPQQAITTRYPGAVWAALRVWVGFEPAPHIRLLSYAMVIRTEANQEIVALHDEDSRWTLLSESFPDDPRHDELLKNTTLSEIDRLATVAAARLDVFRKREQADAEFRKVSLPGVTCEYQTARMLRYLITAADREVVPYIDSAKVVEDLGVSAEEFRAAVKEARLLGLVQANEVLGSSGFAEVRIDPSAFVRLARNVFLDMDAKRDAMTLLNCIGKAGLDGSVAVEEIERDCGLPVPRASILIEYLEHYQLVETDGGGRSENSLPFFVASLLPAGSRVLSGLDDLPS